MHVQPLRVPPLRHVVKQLALGVVVVVTTSGLAVVVTTIGEPVVVAAEAEHAPVSHLETQKQTKNHSI